MGRSIASLAGAQSEVDFTVSVIGNTFDTVGSPLPANFDTLPQTLSYDGSNNLTSVAVTNGTNTWTQTLAYTGSNLTSVSGWAKS